MKFRYPCLFALLIVAISALPAAESTSSLQGRTYLGRNAPVVGATALVHAQESAASLYLTSSDEKGAFRIDGLPDGLYRVRAEREGLKPKLKDEIDVKYPFRAVVELVMEPESRSADAKPDAAATNGDSRALISIAGKVIERNVGAIGEVRLRFVKKGGGDDPRILRSAPDGSFALAAITTGIWCLETDGVGLLPQRIKLTLAADTNLNVIMVRQPPGYEQTPLDLMPAEQPIPPSS